MFTIIGILAVVMIIGAIILSIGYNIFEGALKLICGIIVLTILVFALRGCMM